MSDGGDLYKAIYARPEEDMPRLAYADWLEEHGLERWPKLIRFQCERRREGRTPDDEERQLIAAARKEFQEKLKPYLPGARAATIQFDRGMPQCSTKLHQTPERAEVLLDDTPRDEFFHLALSIRNDFGDIPLHDAMRTGVTSVAVWLIALGMDVNARNNDGNSPLHLAAAYGRIRAADRFVAYGADVNARNAFDNTPLHLAAASGHADMVEWLVTCGADVNARNHDGDTPGRLAQRNRHFTLAEILARTEDRGQGGGQGRK